MISGFTPDDVSDSEEGIFTTICTFVSKQCFVDLGQVYAERSAALLGHEVIERQREIELKKTCLIVSFGDYSKGKWCPGIILFYRCRKYLPS